jgi:hypothetical protein
MTPDLHRIITGHSVNEAVGGESLRGEVHGSSVNGGFSRPRTGSAVSSEDQQSIVSVSKGVGAQRRLC